MNTPVIIDSSVICSWERLIAEDSTLSWVLFEYTDDKYTKLRSKSEGSLGLEEFLKHMDDDSVSWGVYKVITRDESHDKSKIVKSFKCFLVKYIGPNCSVVKKMLVNSHKVALTRAVYCAAEIEASNKSDISEQAMIDKLKAIGCVHDTTTFQFTFWNFNIPPKQNTIETSCSVKITSIGLSGPSTKDSTVYGYEENRDSDYFLVDGYFS